MVLRDMCPFKNEKNASAESENASVPICQKVIRKWMSRLAKVIKNGGEYAPEYCYF
jgi:hypothetical protein